ncbi:undecaprenyl-phosphate alpha-N-acetylglucosaminyl 1-phosphate transferase [Xylocopilactobacillus apis]|uniref:Undecaprenyl-phosphate alpha-N-acetylglucosaminyl 1-phosphate transferase n=2 Tax=Xylocopilactobacillus apis TaxID=2932183 RepID=A0AAU9DGE7_9LACO|nr:undecaprenyl-phosphate alpha-N-acetylglucosaminyl 1-phosphate transferase [Xylocopilactobacillus apis]
MLFGTGLISLCITPFIRKLAFTLGAVDKPNQRRVNKKAIPTIGGLGIFIAVNISMMLFLRYNFPTHTLFSVFIAECVIIITGIIDDIRELRPRQKMLGILIAALIIYYLAGIQMNSLTLPIVGKIQFGIFSMPITIFWILAITNAVNLIDGLDGLATGVSFIALCTMGIIAYFFLNIQNPSIAISIFILAAALLGFLPYNFHPARIFLGDTGALFIGFMISIFSLQGLKNVTFITLLIPVIILGVPVTDTFYAILRRILNKQPISRADKHHLHHQLLQMGFTVPQTVFAIYGISLIFSFISLMYPISSFAASIFLTIFVLLGLELFIEAIGLLGENRHPFLNMIRKFAHRLNRNRK